MMVCVFSAVDCGGLNNPPNGEVDVPQTVFPGMATYTCNSGYSLNGGNTRNCQFNGMWSGSPPTCTGMWITAVSADSQYQHCAYLTAHYTYKKY